MCYFTESPVGGSEEPRLGSSNALGVNCYEVVVIASSAGGIPALVELLSGLPEAFALPVVIAQHLCTSAYYRSVLDDVLFQTTGHSVKWAEAGDLVQPGIVYLAPQDRHVAFQERGLLHVFKGAKVNWSRPAADPLFFSAAEHYGGSAIGVVLSGGSADGSAGAAKLVSLGARVFAQDAESSARRSMPLATMRSCNLPEGMTPSGVALSLVELSCGRAGPELVPGSTSSDQEPPPLPRESHRTTRAYASHSPNPGASGKEHLARKQGVPQRGLPGS
jgi:two-component system, chemotaxis family, protein-glutamate methylesterase/glutaminase